MVALDAYKQGGAKRPSNQCKISLRTTQMEFMLETLILAIEFLFSG